MRACVRARARVTRVRLAKCLDTGPATRLVQQLPGYMSRHMLASGSSELAKSSESDVVHEMQEMLVQRRTRPVSFSRALHNSLGA